MRPEIPSIQTLLQNFFLQRMMQQRKLSAETVHSYRDAFRIYFLYIRDVHRKAPEDIGIEQFDLAYLQGFCRYLEEKRGNRPVTVNSRTAAIKSFMHYVAEIEPAYSAVAKRALMLPAQKSKKPVIEYLTKDEFDSMVGSCDTSTFIGARDKLMLLVLYNTGARVSELLEIKPSDIHRSCSASHASLKLYGKGRKQREVPLWKNTVTYINRYLKAHPVADGGYLFMNKNGDRLTRSGVRTRIDAITAKAAEGSPSLLKKNVSPHTFRHSVAMNLLASGVDISTIAIWLGHSSIETTHKYMVADIELKRKAMERAGTAGDCACRYKPSPGILGFLESL